MRVFVTGATGFVGSAVVPELIRAGHKVVALARSDANAAAIRAAGAQVHMGSLDDPQSLRAGAGAADGVIHTAFNHDFTKFAEVCELDRRAIAALGDGLAGTDKPLIITSGTGLLAGTSLATEDDSPREHPMPRVASEEAAEALAARGVKAMVMRLAPSVHGDGDHGFVPRLIALAKEKGLSAYIGEGNNRWPAVHRLDAAALYRLVLEKGEHGGQAMRTATRYHAVAEEGVAFREIARVIGERLGVPVKGLSPDEAKAHFAWFAMFAGMDNPSSSVVTRAATGWQPKNVGLIEDLEKGTYFGV